MEWNRNLMFSAFVYIIDSSVIYDQRLPALHTALAWSYLPCDIKIMDLPVSIVYEFQVPHQNVAAKITRHYSKISTKLENSWTTCTRPFRSHVCMHQSQTKSLGYDICLKIKSRWKNNSLLYNFSGPNFFLAAPVVVVYHGTIVVNGQGLLMKLGPME